MHRPLAQANRQLVQKFGITGGFSDRIKEVTVQNVVVVGGESLALQFFDDGSGENPERQPVLSRQPEHHIEDIRSTADPQRMPVQMRRVQPRSQHDFDLRSELHLQLVEPDLRQEFTHVLKVVEVPSHLSSRDGAFSLAVSGLQRLFAESEMAVR